VRRAARPGQITAGMSHQGWDLQLSQHSQLGGGIKGERWVARYVSGLGTSSRAVLRLARRRGRRCRGRRGRRCALRLRLGALEQRHLCAALLAWLRLAALVLGDALARAHVSFLRRSASAPLGPDTVVSPVQVVA
jgi:hypothetical protein